MGEIDARSRLIVALDVPTQEEAIELAGSLSESVGTFKIGLQLFTACGPAIVRRVQEFGADVFLDLKLHDIPNTVANAVTEACCLGVSMLTLHTSGGRSMLRKAREAANHFKVSTGRPSPMLLGVTVLTSLGTEEIADIGFAPELDDLVLRLARVAADSRLDGVVSSPLEVGRLRSAGLTDLSFVTPGIRPSSGADRDDQKRVTTAFDAIRAGATYLVVGRPVIKADDPLSAAQALLKEIESAILV